MASKQLKGLTGNVITFNDINVSPEQYTNVHSALFNGDQLGFEVDPSISNGGFSKLINAVTIDWQGANMPNTKAFLNYTSDIYLSDTSQLIDIIERICYKLNNGGIPEPIEPEEPIINSITIDGSTTINIERLYKESYTPVVKANMSDGTQRTLDNTELTWSITSDTESLSLTGAKVTCIKIGTGILTGTLISDNTKTITINITVNPVDIGSNKVSLSGINNSVDWELNKTITQENYILKYSNETLTENTHYTVEYTNNVCTEENQYTDTTATITFRAIDNSNYTGVRTKEFTIKGQEQQVEYYWYCGQSVEQGENTIEMLTNIYIPTIERNFIDESEELKTDAGWRKILQTSYTRSNPLYSPEMTGRLGVKSIYVDGFNEETGERLNESVEYYILIPVDTNIKVYDGLQVPQTIYNTTTINTIEYNIYKFVARKCIYEIY